MAAGGGSSSRRRRRRRSGNGWTPKPKPKPKATQQPSPSPDPSSSPAPADAAPPMPPGAAVEVRVDDAGFHGSWFEATVVDFAPAAPARGRGRRPAPARYTVTYEHLLADDGGGNLAETFAPTHIRPRPPRPDPPPRFRVHDVVEAFHNDGWWSGLVLAAPAPDTDGDITVAFPITREIIEFPPKLVRPRRDYVDGAWVPSRAAMVLRPSRAVKVYTAGEKVEVVRDRDAYGASWFPATVARVVDDLSYLVEYIDLEEEGDGGGEKAVEYLHWRFIRPAVEHCPSESEFQLGPGAAVEAYCDGAWSPGVVSRAVGDGEFEVKVVGKGNKEVVETKVVELLKPRYKWNGKQWRIVAPKRWTNLRRRPMSGRSRSLPIDVTSSGDEQMHNPESFGTKKSRKKLKQLDATSTYISEHASPSEIETPLSALGKPPESNLSPNSWFSEENSSQVLPHGIVNSVPINGLLCTSGHSTPQNESAPNCTEETVGIEETPSEMNVSDGHLHSPICGASADDAHDMLPIAELRKKMASTRRNSAVQQTKKRMLSAKKGISKSKLGKTHPIQELQGKYSVSDNLKGNANFFMKVIVCGLSALMEGQIPSTPDSQMSRQTKRGSSTKVLASKKLASRKGCIEIEPLKVAGPMKESPLPLGSTKSLTQERIYRTLEDTPTITQLSNQEGLFSVVPPGFESMYNGKGTAINGGLLEEEPTAMINSFSQANSNDDVCTDHAAAEVARISHAMETASQGIETAMMNNSFCQVIRNDDVCISHAATKVAESGHVIKTAIVSPDCPFQQAGEKVAKRSCLLLNAGSSQCTMDSSALMTCSSSGSLLPSALPLSQLSGHQVFTKKSAMWPLVEAMDAFKEVPQQPHFLPLREFDSDMREGMALGMMLSFVDVLKSTRAASIDNDMEWFEAKIRALCHLSANGFNVQSLQSTLTMLVQVKSNRSKYLKEMDELKAKLVVKTTSSAQIGSQIDAKDKAIAELERKLGRLRQDSQKMAKDKENEDAEILNIKAEHSRFEEASADAELQFQSILAVLHRKQLT
ncbi:hypothetical protein U9M48_002405 [Paspalum notatum var. saurae]|uniref:Agenet domain-containing protein n=1 Tax=Paspalum notatum var. saurae TaxID=547442 RepID=A0AAQ3PJF2_PASNO